MEGHTDGRVGHVFATFFLALHIAENLYNHSQSLQKMGYVDRGGGREGKKSLRKNKINLNKVGFFCKWLTWRTPHSHNHWRLLFSQGRKNAESSPKEWRRRQNKATFYLKNNSCMSSHWLWSVTIASFFLCAFSKYVCYVSFLTSIFDFALTRMNIFSSIHSLWTCKQKIWTWPS